MGTARDLLNNSLRTLQVLASGEAATAAEAADGLVLLNELLAAWNLEELIVYQIVRNTYTLVAGTSTYTLGVGGTLTSTRPNRVERLGFYDTSESLEIPMRLLDYTEYADIGLKGTPSTWPRWGYYDAGYPQASLILYPVPSENNQVVLYTWVQLSALSTLDSTIDMPPGFSLALRYNLAVHLAPEYSAAVTPELAALASSSKAAIKRPNARVPLLGVDDGLRQVRTFDWRVGDTV